MNNYPNSRLTDLSDFTFKTRNEGIIKATGQKVYCKKANSSQNTELLQEYNELIKCCHPLIQYPIGIYQASNDCSLFTPFQKFGSLRMFMESQHNFSGYTTDKLIISIGIAFGMEYLHQINIIHGCLDTRHILVNERRHPILIGFGITGREITNDIRLYSSPEILRNESYSKSSDVYSFGLVINEIFSEEIPFKNVSLEDMTNIKNNGTFHIDQSLPVFLQDIVRRCLHPDKELRPAFSDILSEMITNIISTNPSKKIISFIEEIQIRSKQKQTFKIPLPLIELPNENIKYERNMKNPVILSKFKKILNPDEKKKAILIMVFGDNRRSFIKSLTGNNAHFQSFDEIGRFKRILIDGPYQKNHLIENIIDNDFKEKFNSINISDDTQIFFIDYQDDEVDDINNNYSIVINRLFPIFSVISTVCISIVNPNISSSYLTYLVRNLNLIPKNKPAKIFFLVKNFEKFDQLTELNYETILNFNRDEIENHFLSIINETDYNSNQKYVILPIGNSLVNYKSYIFSVWYSFLNILLSIDENDLISKDKIINALIISSYSIFGENYNDFIKCFIEEKAPASLKNLRLSFPTALNYAFYNYKVYLICNDLAIKKIINILSFLFKPKSNELIEIIILFYSNVFMPLILRNKQIPVYDIHQWSNDLKKDINSFLKANYLSWLKYVNFEKCSFLFDDIFEIDPKLYLYSNSQNENDIFDSIFLSTMNVSFVMHNFFQTSSFPFIWDYLMMDYISIDIDIFFETKIISNLSEHFILFFEQCESNDSSIIIRSLTGFNVDFKNTKKCAKLFKNIPINKMMIRLKKNRQNPHISKLLDPPIKKVSLLYIKGYTQKQIKDFCKEQLRAPIFVSSMLGDQQIKIIPTLNFPVNMFVISNDSFDFEVANRKNYVKNMNAAKEIVTSISPEMKNINFLPIKSKDYNFIKSGPVAHNLLRYGCRYILKDESFFKDQ